ncbi:MAG: restriction endonuclease [SAR324 cluster bacterium]|nr:restriction endonuclease [SAR324 cluster bacterium]
MKYPSIRIEGSILSADILDKIEQGDVKYGQSPQDFNLDSSIKVKDEIVRAWADAQDLWRIFRRRTDSLRDMATGTTETRNLWMMPLLELLGFDVEFAGKGEELNGKNYAISHRVSKQDQFPIHIMGFRDSLDKKREDSGPRMSPHALVQEYLNLTEHLFALVTNGYQLRLLRDSSRLIKLSFLEFDLARMMDDGLFTDFALMFRLLHASRLPITQDTAAECLLERYHQDSLDSGSRIREGLSSAVEDSILKLGNGFLTHPANTKLREALEHNRLQPMEFYQWLLRLIYRLLFLMVIEERDLIYPQGTDRNRKSVYYDYYSLQRLRKLAEHRHFADKNYQDYWAGLKSTFRLFESSGSGDKLNIKPLAGDLFRYNAIGLFNECALGNDVLLHCLQKLTIFNNPVTGQVMRVNYAALNVEEFGSVYEGLLEYDPAITLTNGQAHFQFVQGAGRSSSGSHYTPDELVQPLIKHSLDYLIEDKLKEADKEKALLSLRVCDVACGSGHILLNAARRIATELAIVRTGEEQPSPTAFRAAVRDVIRHCIYGVDLNLLAVELCKVALWLEAHNPGEPLNFLDHHIKCGNAIVGLAHKEELERGIAEEAFKTLPDDDKTTATTIRTQNNKERKEKGRQVSFHYETAINHSLQEVKQEFVQLATMPESSLEEIELKNQRYQQLLHQRNLWNLKVLADIQVAQFFIPKTTEHRQHLITHSEYLQYLRGERQPIGQAVAQAMAVAQEKHFFHWFLEFPDILEQGGFDCILGNPPFLGGQKLSGTFGAAFLEWVKLEYAPAGSADIVTYFFRRIYELIRSKGFQALISTNTIAQGGSREGGLDVIHQRQGTINFAIRSIRWPGRAAVDVSLLSIHKGNWKKLILDNKPVSQITTFLDDSETLTAPYPLHQNENKSFQGSIVLGKGFVLEPKEAQRLIAQNPKNKEVLFPYLNGEDLNSRPDQSPSRWVINFFDWPEEQARQYPECFQIVEEKVKPEREMNKYSPNAKKLWWLYERYRQELYRTIAPLERVLVINRHSKDVKFLVHDTKCVYSEATVVVAEDTPEKWGILNSSLHEYWAWKYSSTMGSSTLRYSASDCFQTFPFPQTLTLESPLTTRLNQIGEAYHEHRRQWMLKTQLGLTKTYNAFHASEIGNGENREIGSRVKKLFPTSLLANPSLLTEALQGILKLRKLHVQMDNAVLEAYGWHQASADGPALELRHDFYEVEFLPENDRIRYTIHPEARKEILKRLLLLNHKIHAGEEANGLHKKKKPSKKSAEPPPEEDSVQRSLF